MASPWRESDDFARYSDAAAPRNDDRYEPDDRVDRRDELLVRRGTKIANRTVQSHIRE